MEAFEIGGGASQIELTLPRPVGTVPITVGGGASHITLRRPEGCAARILVGGGAAKSPSTINLWAPSAGACAWNRRDTRRQGTATILRSGAARRYLTVGVF